MRLTLPDVLKTLYERNAFGVCAQLGERLQIPTSRIRLLFIYSSFFTAGSPLIVYFIMLGLMEFRKNLQRHRANVWDF
jgi:phage shock protein C